MVMTAMAATLNQALRTKLTQPLRTIRRKVLTHRPNLSQLVILVLRVSPVTDDFAVFNSDNATLKTVNNFLVVGSQDNGRTVTVNFFQYADNIPGVLRVKVTGWLIGNQNFWLSNN